MEQHRYWIAVIGENDFQYLRRKQLRELTVAIDESKPRPVLGDDVAVLHSGAFIEVGEVRHLLEERPLRLRLRRKVRAPAGTALSYTSFAPALGCAVAWTAERLDDLAGSFIEISKHDSTRISDALLAVALRFGPRASRPVHRRPRTPGRRRLVAAKATAFKRPRR